MDHPWHPLGLEIAAEGVETEEHLTPDF